MEEHSFLFFEYWLRLLWCYSNFQEHKESLICFVCVYSASLHKVSVIINSDFERLTPGPQSVSPSRKNDWVLWWIVGICFTYSLKGQSCITDFSVFIYITKSQKELIMRIYFKLNYMFFFHGTFSVLYFMHKNILFCARFIFIF